MRALPSRNSAAASVRSAAEGSACSGAEDAAPASVSISTSRGRPIEFRKSHYHRSAPFLTTLRDLTMNISELPDLIGGRYRPIRKLGEGSMGFVFEVEHAVTFDRLALKVMRTHSTPLPGVVDR